MPVRLTRRALVVMDSDPRSQAALEMITRHTRKVLVISGEESVGESGQTEVIRSLGGTPTMTEVLRTAVERRIPLVAMRRDIAPTDTLLRELILAAGRVSTDNMPGFAVLLATPQPRPLRRMLLVVDRGTGPITGFMMFVAERFAERAGAIVDVLVLGAPGEELTSDDEDQTVQVNREAELYGLALERARNANLTVNWITTEEVGDKWAVVRNQLVAEEYDLVVDEIGELSIRGALRRGITLEEALEPGQVGDISRHLLEETELPVLLVIDDVRLGIGTPAVGTRMAAAAAVALTVVTGGLAASSAAPSEVGASAADSTDLLADAAVLTAQIDKAQDTAQAADDRSERVSGSSRSATKTTKVKLVTPKLPKGGADSRDVSAAKTAEKKEKKQYRVAKDALAAAAKAEQRANEQLAKAQDELDDSARELQAAQAALTAAQVEADRLESESESLVGLVTGGADEGERAAAAKAVSDAQLWIERATARGEQALEVLDRATAKEEKTDQALAKAQKALAKAKAEYQQTQVTADTFEDSYAKAQAAERARLAKLKRAPVAKGSYHFTARFGQSGSHWASGYHTGLDFAGPVGTDVHAAKSGRVISAGWAGAYGNRIEIKHANGIVTTYNHLSRINVSPGQRVGTGDKIGDMGSTGNSTGPHLHFEVKKNGNFIDPAAWLGL